jgi:hypothetical protein
VEEVKSGMCKGRPSALRTNRLLVVLRPTLAPAVALFLLLGDNCRVPDPRKRWNGRWWWCDPRRRQTGQTDGRGRKHGRDERLVDRRQGRDGRREGGHLDLGLLRARSATFQCGLVVLGRGTVGGGGGCRRGLLLAPSGLGRSGCWGDDGVRDGRDLLL